MSGHDDSKRKAIHVQICAPGAETLRAFCISHGVTITAFLDALSHVLCHYTDAPMPELEAVAPSVAEALLAARQIDADRRTREPRLT